jgi:predicted membrane protein
MEILGYCFLIFVVFAIISSFSKYVLSGIIVLFVCFVFYQNGGVKKYIDKEEHQLVKTVEIVKEISQEEIKRAEYIVECMRYGFAKDKCETIWDGEVTL